MRKISIVQIFATVLLGAGLMSAQATRTWVSGVGDDANPCSRTAPCKTFAGAISKTAVGGEIDVLDPGGFGAVTITKAITLDGGGGQVASILVSGTPGIIIQAPANATVTIRNIRINGVGTGTSGIKLNTGGVVHIEYCLITGFTGAGLDIEPTSGGQVTVTGTISRDNAYGILAGTSGSNVSVAVENSTFNSNSQTGVFAGTNSRVSVRNSEASGNGNQGYLATANSGSSELDLTDSSANNNAVGVQAGGGTAAAVVNANRVSLNNNSSNGFFPTTNGTINTFGNNYKTGAGAATPNGTATPQ